jgi:hypothetical protein
VRARSRFADRSLIRLRNLLPKYNDQLNPLNFKEKTVIAESFDCFRINGYLPDV